MRTSLFRPEVSASKRTSWLGPVLLTNPLSFRFFSGFSLITALILFGFIFFAHYTKRVQVSGVLIPNLGLIRIQSPQAGIVLERRVHEGQQVHAGDVLYVMSSELELAIAKDDTHTVNSNGAILSTLRARQASVGEERAQTTRIGEQQIAQSTAEVAGMTAEITQLDQEISTQRARVVSAQSQYQRDEQMQVQGFISTTALQQKHDELLDQRGRLQNLERTRLTLNRNVSDARANLAAQATKNSRDQTQLSRQSLELEQQSLATESHRQFLITAPVAGTVTAILVDPGQAAANQTLLTILPADAHLEAHLYVPSRSVGFIEAGQRVAIRFAAFPYQKFGQRAGVVLDVSRTVLAQQDLSARLEGGGGSANSEGMYRVRVALLDQSNAPDRKQLPLSSGMQLDADILQDQRTLIEWILEPIFGLKEKV